MSMVRAEESSLQECRLHDRIETFPGSQVEERCLASAQGRRLDAAAAATAQWSVMW